MSDELKEQVTNHLATLPAHAKQRRTAALLAQCLAEITRLEQVVAALEWTPDKDARRATLIHKKHHAGLDPAEAIELAKLQTDYRCHYSRYANMPDPRA